MRQHTAEEKHKISMRINRDLLNELQAAAKRESRTANSYMIHLLTQDLLRKKNNTRQKP